MENLLKSRSRSASCECKLGECINVSPCIFLFNNRHNTNTCTFHSTPYYSNVLISLKYIKIFKGTPTCFDLKRSSSGSMLLPC